MLIKENPLWGIGYLMYWKTHPLQLHNSYLLILVEFGIVGALFFALYLFSLLGVGLKKSVQLGFYIFKTRLSILFLVLIVPNTIDFLNNAYFMLSIFTMTAIFNMENSTQKED